DLAVPIALIRELSAHLAERDIMDRTGVQPARQPLYVQVFDTNQIEFFDQSGREPVQGALALLPHPGMHSRHPQPLLLASPTALLASREAPLLLTQVPQAGV